MARKKREEEGGIQAGWINTFADLMNLLLCFFVLLFSMSTVDADKYEQLVTSMSESINIFDGGGSAVGEGAFVSSGTDQMISISEFFNEFENSGEDSQSKKDQDTKDPGENKTQGQANNGAEGKDPDKKQDASDDEIAKLKGKAVEIYDTVMDQADKKNIDSQITVNMDENYQFVQISLNGALLFDSGAAEIKKSTRSLLSKVGDILKLYDKQMIKIEGHTDNVPISGGQYKNNLWLSLARATEVFEYMVNEKKLDPKTLEATGRGKFDPVDTNKTAKGRARNRRVELKIYTDDVNKKQKP